MAILNYISVTSAATPVPPDSQTPTPPNPRPTKIILPKKKPMKWSTGVAPGEYGGPPTTTKLRKYWGGEGEDPLSSDEFIWNKDFVGRFKRMIQEEDGSSLESLRVNATQARPMKVIVLADEDLQASQQEMFSLAKGLGIPEEPSGFLSLNRVMTLDSLEVDLSKELTRPLKTVSKQPVEDNMDQDKSSALPRWRPAPTRREQEKWDRASKAATGGSDVMFRELRRPRGDPNVLAAQSKERYYKLKEKLQVLTLGVGGIGLVSTYFCYSPEIAASFGAGFLGSLVYIRMLGSSVDSMADGAKGLMKGAIGQPRLLVPVVLVMIYNRWNAILVPEYGTMHLELIPMLVGFFTYKIAAFVQAVEESVSTLTKNNRVPDESSS